MKKLFVLCLLTIGLKAVSQDLILTADLDTIRCKISNIDEVFIYFVFANEGEYMNSIIPHNQVRRYQYKAFPDERIPVDGIFLQKDFKRFKLGGNYGLSYRLAAIPSGLDPILEDYLMKLKFGRTWGIDAKYFFTEKGGIGVHYNRYSASNKLENVAAFDSLGNLLAVGYLEDIIKMNFLGLSYAGRKIIRNKVKEIYYSAGMGYLSYRNDAVLIDERLKYTGSTLGILLDFGYDIKVSKEAMIGFKFSYISGVLTQVEVSNGQEVQTLELEEGEYEGLNRIDFTIGIRF